MNKSIVTKKLRISGMTCTNCQNIIEKQLLKTTGVEKATVNYSSETAVITYNENLVSLNGIKVVINNMDYQVLPENERQRPNTSRVIGLLLIIISLDIFLEHFGLLNMLAPSQLAETNMEYGMLFVIGLITSVHCIAMCGGINLSQCIPRTGEAENKSRLSTFIPAFQYNFGRVISYTAVGFIVGAIGQAITFTNTAQGILKLIAGMFMVIMGINMLGVFPWLRRLTPRMPKAFARKINNEKASRKSPLIVGILNGFMPCGPLQAMQIYALSTGSPIAGALSMMLFSLGTVPLMFGLGAISSALGKKFTNKVMSVGAVLVVVLGLSMLTQGWSLTGFNSLSSLPGSASEVADDTAIINDEDVQTINSTLSSRRYPQIAVQAGKPVKWIIDAPQGSINGCNNRFFIPEYNIEHTFEYGENIIEFTPTRTGTFQYQCWMGMIRSTITVLEAGADSTQSSGSSENTEASTIPEPQPANYIIPADEIAAAEIITEGTSSYQRVTIELTDEGFNPAVVVIQAGVGTEWIINNTSSKNENFKMLVPIYMTALNLVPGDNPLRLSPTESFDFSNGNNTFYGYVKVTDNLKTIDYDALKEEVRSYKTMIWPPEFFQFSGN